MFEGLDLSKMSEMMEQVQAKAKEIEEKTKSTILTAKGGGGMVTVSANGAGEIVDIDIDDSLLDDKEALQILLISTINEVLKSVEENKKSQAMSLMGGLNPFATK